MFCGKQVPSGPHNWPLPRLASRVGSFPTTATTVCRSRVQKVRPKAVPRGNEEPDGGPRWRPERRSGGWGPGTAPRLLLAQSHPGTKANNSGVWGRAPKLAHHLPISAQPTTPPDRDKIHALPTHPSILSRPIATLPGPHTATWAQPTWRPRPPPRPSPPEPTTDGPARSALECHFGPSALPHAVVTQTCLGGEGGPPTLSSPGTPRQPRTRSPDLRPFHRRSAVVRGEKVSGARKKVL